MAMVFIVLKSSRRNAVGAILAIAAFVPLGQKFTLLGLNFYFLRILILAGVFRVLTRRETLGFKFVMMDTLFICLLATGLICDLIRGVRAQAFGVVYDAAGVYFLIRIWTQTAEDVVAHFRLLAFVAIVIGACMTFETLRHQNPFYVFGGVPKIPMERSDRFRAQGPFLQPIPAGTFGATLFPLLASLWLCSKKGRGLLLLGIIGSTMITVASASSGPLLTFVAAVIGFCLWPMRHRMSIFRRSIVVVLIGFTLVMNAPVWYIIAKVSDVIGGGGWHRSWLIDQFVRHFSQWWLVGTSYTADWAPGGEVLPNNPNMMDITNEYVAQGIHGGLLGLILFVVIIVVCFKTIGRFVLGTNDLVTDRIFLWGLGVCLAAHCMAFISVSYFDQIQVFWFWLLALIAGIPLWSVNQSATHACVLNDTQDLEEDPVSMNPEFRRNES